MGFFSALGKVGRIAGAVAPFALAPITGGASLAGLAAGGGIGGAISMGAKLAGMAGQAAGGIDSALHGGVDATTRGAQAANRQNQAIKNRFSEAALTPGAVSADRQAFANMMRASNIARFKPNQRGVDLMNQYGRHVQTPTPEAMQFAGAMRDQLQQRLKNGQALTVNGVAAPGAAELADAKTAQQMSTGSPGGVLGAIQTGSRLAQMVPGGMFGGKPNVRTPPFVGPLQDNIDYGDDGNSYYGGR